MFKRQKEREREVENEFKAGSFFLVPVNRIDSKMKWNIDEKVESNEVQGVWKESTELVKKIIGKK